MNLLLAVVGSLGVLLIWTGLTHPFIAHISGSRRRLQLRADQGDKLQLSPF